MASEVDPLLPKIEPSPEITGYGFSRRRTEQQDHIGADTTDHPRPSYSSFLYHQDDKKQGGEDEPQGQLFHSDAGDVILPEDPDYDSHRNHDEDESSEDGSLNPRTALTSLVPIGGIAILFTLIAAALLPGGLHFGRGDSSQPPAEPVPSATSSVSASLSPSSTSHPSPSAPISSRVASILKRTPLIDGHNDLAILLRYLYGNDIKDPEFRGKFENGGLEGHVDVPRLKEGMIGGSFWSAFVLCPANASYDWSDENYAKATAETLSQIDLLRRLTLQYPSTFSPINLPPSSYLTRFLSPTNSTLFTPLSIEGLHQLPPSSPFSFLRTYRSLGIRAATLTWNCHNAFADAALITEPGDNPTIVAPPTPGRNGLSPHGRALIREMNRIGIIVDISHTSALTQRAVLSNATSAAPVIFSHSSVFALCPHPRNVRDDVLDLVQATDSVVMINFAPDFVSCLPREEEGGIPEFYDKNNTLAHVARHIMYVGEKIGYRHVGLGSDFDGIQSTPRGLERGVADFPALVAELLGKGVTDQHAEGVVGGNLLRVWEEVERVAQEMQDRGEGEGVDEVKEQILRM
ncbi:MAG: hypothetical protein Q9160_008256 [Pyrenula sp. 1 TL-2023]